MDSRTIKIRDLKYKLAKARNLIRDLAIQCATMENNKQLSRSYWGREAICRLEDTKE